MSLRVRPVPHAMLGGQLLPALQQRVLAMVDHDDVVLFSIGRTSDLRATETRHQAEIVPLLTTWCPWTIVALEGALIRLLHCHPKNRNRARHGGGRIADPPYYLYVAVSRSSVPCRSFGALAAAGLGGAVVAGLSLLLATRP